MKRQDRLSDTFKAVALWLANGLDPGAAKVVSVGDDAVDILRHDGGRTIMMGMILPTTLRCCVGRGRGRRPEYANFDLNDPASLDSFESWLAARGLVVSADAG